MEYKKTHNLDVLKIPIQLVFFFTRKQFTFFFPLRHFLSLHLFMDVCLFITGPFIFADILDFKNLQVIMCDDNNVRQHISAYISIYLK